MSTVAFRSALVREIEQAMKRTERMANCGNRYRAAFDNGKMEAYAHVLTLVKDEDL